MRSQLCQSFSFLAHTVYALEYFNYFGRYQFAFPLFTIVKFIMQTCPSDRHKNKWQKVILKIGKMTVFDFFSTGPEKLIIALDDVYNILFIGRYKSLQISSHILSFLP